MKTTSQFSLTPHLVQQAILVLLLPYLLIFASTQSSLTDPLILSISGFVFVILGLFFFVLTSARSHSLELPAFACFSVGVLTTLTSIDPRRSVIELWLISVELFLFLLFIRMVRKNWEAETIFGGMLIVGAIFMMLAWVEAGQWYTGWLKMHPGQFFPETSYRLPAPNFLCVAFNVWLMLALARLWWSRSRVEKVLLGLYSLSSLALIYLTSSRGGWIGTLAGLGSLLVIAVYLAPEKWRGIWGKIQLTRGGVVGLALAFLAALSLFAWMMFRQDFQPSHSPLFQSRNYLWGPAWHAFLSSPVVGKGPFTFVSQYLQEISVPPGYFFDYAHSIYLDLVSSSGLLGLTAVAWLGYGILKALITPLRSVSASTKGVLIGSLAALAAFAVHGLFDSVHHTVPSSAWNLAIILGTSVGAASISETASPKRRRISVVGVIAIPAVLGFWVCSWLMLPMARGVDAAERGLWGEAAHQFAVAVQRDPFMAITHQQAGMAHSMLYQQSGDKADLQKAIQRFDRAVYLDPDWALNHANLAALYFAQGEYYLAQEQFLEAVRLAPGSAVYPLNLAQADEALGQNKEAQARYENVLKLMPSWKTAPYWQKTDLRRNFIANWTLSHPDEQHDIVELESLYEGDPSSALHGKELIAAYLEAGEINAAEKAYEECLSGDLSAAGRVEIQWWGAEIAAQKGDLETATNLGSSAVDMLRNQGMPGPGFGLSAAYANYMFRSRAVGQDAVPQMTRILFTGEWEERLYDLESWYEEMGQGGEAERIRELLREF